MPGLPCHAAPGQGGAMPLPLRHMNYAEITDALA
jgi:hypothetical protein